MFKKESDNGASRRFTVVDIERYHRGQMTGEERHALERAALEDPFLEEALEGYALLPAGQAAGDLAALRERLAQRVSPRRRAAAWWAAAAAVVVLGGAFVVYRMGGKKEMAKVARVADTIRAAPGEAPVAARVADTVPVAVEAKTAPNAVAEARVAPHRKRRRTLGATETANDSAMTAIAATPSAAAPPNEVTDSAMVAMASTNAKPMAFGNRFARKAVPETLIGRVPGLMDTSEYIEFKDQIPGKILVDGKRFFGNNEPGMFKNRVIDYNHQPIAGATLKIGPAENYVMTDQKGFFRFNGLDSQRVVVTAVGYEPKTYFAYELNNLAAVQLSQDSNMLNDVVVVGYGVPKSKKAMSGYHAVIDTNAAQPLEGWSSYNEYISNNLQLPDPVLENHIHGEVDLAFEVDGAGKPVNISVVKSLCASCDAEAVRLLRQGPGWSKGKKAKGRKVRGKLKVKF